MVVANTLVDMYAKCGSLEKAWDIFDKMYQRNTVCRTTIITGYAMHACAKEALELFELMKHCSMKPDHSLVFCLHVAMQAWWKRAIDTSIA